MNHLQLELEKLGSANEQVNNDLRCQIEQWTNAETTYVCLVLFYCLNNAVSEVISKSYYNSQKQEETAMKQHITDLTNKLNQAENNKQSLIQDINCLKSDSSVKDSKMSEFQEKLVQFEKVASDSDTQHNEIKSKYDVNMKFFELFFFF